MLASLASSHAYPDRLSQVAARFESLKTEADILVGSLEYNTKSSAQSEDINKSLINKARSLYSRLELLKLDIIEGFNISVDAFDNKEQTQNKNDKEEIILIRNIESILKQLVLRPIRNTKMTLLFTVEFLIRMMSCILTLIPVGTALSFVILIFRVFSNNIAESLRRFIGNLFLKLAGIYVRIDNKFGDVTFQRGCSLLAFTHCSNLDGFLISATCPVRHFAFGKKELFLIPFFSWMSLAVGGIPVDRQNNRKSVNALRRTTEKAARVVEIKHGSNTTTSDYDDSYQSCCLVIAPEGTRSPTGQLLPFKKGTFHIWEQLKNDGVGSPVVPLVILGAYELYPTKHIFSEQGLVVVRYLKPIQPDEATTREAMDRLLRRRICEASIDVPEDLCRKLTLRERSVSLLISIIALIVDVLYIYFSYKFCEIYFGLSNKQIVLFLSVGSLILTVLMYVYFVYIVDFLYQRKKETNDAKDR